MANPPPPSGGDCCPKRAPSRRAKRALPNDFCVVHILTNLCGRSATIKPSGESCNTAESASLKAPQCSNVECPWHTPCWERLSCRAPGLSVRRALGEPRGLSCVERCPSHARHFAILLCVAAIDLYMGAQDFQAHPAHSGKAEDRTTRSMVYRLRMHGKVRVLVCSCPPFGCSRCRECPFCAPMLWHMAQEAAGPR